MSLDEPIPKFLLTYFCDDCKILWQDRYESACDGQCPMCHTKHWVPLTQDGWLSWEHIFDKAVKKEMEDRTITGKNTLPFKLWQSRNHELK